MKIKGSEKIRKIFSIFHDGGIVNCQIENDTLMMDVEIQYLAERINPSFRKFSIALTEVGSIRFLTWPNDLQSEPALMTDVKTIFKSDLEILEANIKGGEIQIVCNQCSPEFNYCGGELYFTAVSAEVMDEVGKSYSISELEALCKGYWDEWQNDNVSHSRD